MVLGHSEGVHVTLPVRCFGRERAYAHVDLLGRELLILKYNTISILCISTIKLELESIDCLLSCSCATYVILISTAGVVATAGHCNCNP